MVPRGMQGRPRRGFRRGQRIPEPQKKQAGSTEAKEGKGIDSLTDLDRFIESRDITCTASSYIPASPIFVETQTLPDCRICPKPLTNHRTIIRRTKKCSRPPRDQPQALLTPESPLPLRSCYSHLNSHIHPSPFTTQNSHSLLSR